MDKTPQPKGDFLKEIIKFSIIAFIIVVPIRLYVAQPFIVSGASMSPTFESGNYLIVDQLSYKFKEPNRGDVIIFRFPQDPSKFFIKRIIGLPGETIEIAEGAITIKNSTYPEGFFINEPYVELVSKRSTPLTTVLLDDEYFVLGDNRGASSDSRSWGPLQENLIVGKALLRLLPVTALDILPGDYSRELDVPQLKFFEE